MRKLSSSVYALSLTFVALQAGEITKYVDSFIGTGAVDGGLSGNNYPRATLSFDMIQLSPNASEAPSQGDALSYDYNRDTIFGFSHTRLSGTGTSDPIDITLMPTSSGRTFSAFTHDAKRVRPGYYQVMLKDENINAELTTTQRNGIRRYQCPAGKDVGAVLDVDHSAGKDSWECRIASSQIRILNNHAVEGHRIITGWAKLRKIYFYMEFPSPVLTSTLRDNGRIHENTAVIGGTNFHDRFRFGQLNGRPLACRVALSSVFMENARQNMEQGALRWDSDRHVATTDADWEKQLGKIETKGTEVQKEIFCMALYHTMMQPNTMSNMNDGYVATDCATRKVADNKTRYTTFFLWDIFRASHLLCTLLGFERVTGLVGNVIRQYEYYGYLPIWRLWGRDNYCMIGSHPIPVITDVILEGAPGIGMEKTYEAIYNSSVTSHLNSPSEI